VAGGRAAAGGLFAAIADAAAGFAAIGSLVLPIGVLLGDALPIGAGNGNWVGAVVVVVPA
jgi:hypothetical protein